MSKDYNGWPLVPCDPKAIPDGYEPVKVGWAMTGEASVIDKVRVYVWGREMFPHFSPRLIIRPIPKPIRLPLNIVPHGWWVVKDNDGWVCLHDKETRLSTGRLHWVSEGRIWPLPPWIAAQLPAEWHELPWDQSAMQQTEGGDT